ncbi:potassium-transporting ATPase subunit KdpB [Xenorhabdus nematophila]|uniref:potassium-transporting ATPase subunit KdpB n=1 Tax=Xenorhabdus nematophila TaxID=628 RepID=UPI0003275D51|nr:potassium-transporting ATPase subunit KdpB [Xenorhabdus nematophila]CEF32249.1 P-type ATPase, high-affinity potassium transport system, B chain, a phophatase-like domain [Xenorhabdus nematophila str. Websteri]AYA39672.1 K(+)-transporting ATPase subunit B [Xenorhabdus nematophila]KHD29717.1 potassium-transporting ATPase subunit B [Xenorhabdus nematophila]MBA0018242.1 potassium-transporting ATPase subunit KdpB [Xenorhabdus nematophila]MCB4424327.1 potassium-transporting ATPase subunit KdpB [X
MKNKQQALFEPNLIRQALIDSLKKCHPALQWHNPVMFVVYLGSCLTTALWIGMLAGQLTGNVLFTGSIALWLWFTVLFANFAEALAEGRSKAQASSLKGVKKASWATKLTAPDRKAGKEKVISDILCKGDIVLVEAGDIIPCDGEVLEGGASVDESAITGESAPVIRESGGDFSSVTGGTRVLSDWLIIKCTVNSGETFLDRMISMVEGAKRRKTPNEIALTILLTALTIIFLLVCVSLLPFSLFSVQANQSGAPITLTVLIALLICLIPTTIGGLLSAIGVAGMSRMLSANVIATSGRAIEAAGDVDVLLLDKTGTITLGNRQASQFLPAPGITEQQLADAAQLSSLADETPEGRSIVILAKQRFNLRERDLLALNAKFIPFSAITRMSGINIGNRMIRKGAVDAIRRYIEANHSQFPEAVDLLVQQVAHKGGTPLVVSENQRVLGVVALKDIVKGGIKERFNEMRKMGIKTVMITGDNHLTAAAIAAEAGVDDFLAEATPEAKLALIRQYQSEGRLVAMTGDGTNDAPALAQADVAVAMNSGTQAAKEAGNMVDLDSNPTKLIEVVHIGKQMLMTRGSLTTFSIANDIAKYFAIIPAAFAVTYPQLNALNIMHLHSPESAILSAVIFNAIIIIFLLPLALKGVSYQPMNALSLLRRNLWIYGLSGLLVPFAVIKLIDILLAILVLK